MKKNSKRASSECKINALLIHALVNMECEFGRTSCLSRVAEMLINDLSHVPGNALVVWKTNEEVETPFVEVDEAKEPTTESSTEGVDEPVVEEAN